MDRFYQIRKLTYGHPTGDSQGITIPTKVANSYQNIQFTIHNGSVLLTEQNNIIEHINITFKELSKQIPAEHYSTIRSQQLQLREKVNEIFNPIKSSIILKSGCKTAMV